MTCEAPGRFTVLHILVSSKTTYSKHKSTVLNHALPNPAPADLAVPEKEDSEEISFLFAQCTAKLNRSVAQPASQR
jgi:hypothetical protein